MVIVWGETIKVESGNGKAKETVQIITAKRGAV